MNCEYGKCARIILPMFCVWLKSSAASTCLIKQTKCQCCMGKQAEERVPSQDTYGQTVTASARESSVPAAPAVRRTELVARGPVAVFVAAHFATDTGMVNHPVAVDIAMQHVRREQHLTQRSAAENMQNFDTFLLENHQRVFLLVTPFLF